MSGEGISCGSVPRRSTIKIASTNPRNSTSGISKYLFMLFNGGRCRSCSYLDCFRFLNGLGGFLLRQRITPVADGESAANGHQQRATPNPVDQRLVIDAHSPTPILRRIAGRRREIAPDAAIDRSLGVLLFRP